MEEFLQKKWCSIEILDRLISYILWSSIFYQCWSKYCFSNFLGEYIHLIFDNGTSLNCDLQNFGAIKDGNTVEIPYEKYPKYCELVSTFEQNNQSMVRTQDNVAANHKNFLHFWLFLGHILFRNRIRRILIF